MRAGSGGHFPEREKQDVFPAASMDEFTAVREMPSRAGLNLSTLQKYD